MCVCVCVCQLLEVQKSEAAYGELEDLVVSVEQLLAENPTPALQPEAQADIATLFSAALQARPAFTQVHHPRTIY